MPPVVGSGCIPCSHTTMVDWLHQRFVDQIVYSCCLYVAKWKSCRTDSHLWPMVAQLTHQLTSIAISMAESAFLSILVHTSTTNSCWLDIFVRQHESSSGPQSLPTISISAWPYFSQADAVESSCFTIISDQQCKMLLIRTYQPANAGLNQGKPKPVWPIKLWTNRLATKKGQ